MLDEIEQQTQRVSKVCVCVTNHVYKLLEH